jgi:hypothetical protein
LAVKQQRKQNMRLQWVVVMELVALALQRVLLEELLLALRAVPRVLLEQVVHMRLRSGVAIQVMLEQMPVVYGRLQ